MTPAPEAEARVQIDATLTACGWLVQDISATNIHAGRGVAICEFPLASGHGFADYLLYVDGKAAGVIEAKKVGVTLTGVETQSDKYTKGLPEGLPRWHNPLPFSYQSTGVETRFTNGLDPEPRSREVFAFHRPEILAEWLDSSLSSDDSIAAEDSPIWKPQTFLSQLQNMPELITEGLWPAQIKAIENLEVSLKENRPRALIQMATGSGKTFTSINFIYRLLKFAGARRVLFLVDRGNLGRQTLKEFRQFVSPYNNFYEDDEVQKKKMEGEAFVRDPEVRRQVRKRSQGICEYCGDTGFTMSNGKLYVEVHHVIPLSEGGPDNTSNVVALCPSHHREAHYGANSKQIGEKLLGYLTSLN